MAACQPEEDATMIPEDTTNQQDATTTAFSSTPEPETFTTLTAWGDNYFSQLGDGTYGNKRTTPVRVGDLDGIEAISAGGAHSLALKDDDTAWAREFNQSGQLGDGTVVGINTPVQVSELGGIKAIDVGSNQSLAGW